MPSLMSSAYFMTSPPFVKCVTEMNFNVIFVLLKSQVQRVISRSTWTYAMCYVVYLCPDVRDKGGEKEYILPNRPTFKICLSQDQTHV